MPERNRATPLHFIGYASGMAAADPSCSVGPTLICSTLQHRLEQAFAEKSILYPEQIKSKLEAIDPLRKLNQRLANQTSHLVTTGKRFVVCGGDHSSAIGTWSGVADALGVHGPLGLIWIDAHMDSHTPETSWSQNLHGMPLAVLLGYGPEELTRIGPYPALHPENLCLIGIRRFEPEEARLLERLGVTVYDMQHVKSSSLSQIWSDALALVKKNTIAYGVSLDLDAIDPTEAPGTGSREPDGLSSAELLNCLKELPDDPKWTGIEIAEFNPRLDQNHQTEELILHYLAVLANHSEI